MNDLPDKSGFNKPKQKKIPELHLAQLIPNLVTIIAICAGLTAIRFGVAGNYERAVMLLVAAGVLDGLDGRIARLLKSDSKMGAELDSLADFVNFGVAPSLVVYYWALQDMRSAGWICVLVFTVCCVLRLARFNVSHKFDADHDDSGYFAGVPSPAGAGLVMMPMFLSFAVGTPDLIPPLAVGLNMIVIGLLEISRIPTWSFNAITVARPNVKFLFVGVVFVGAAVLTYTWFSLMAIGITYVAVVIWTIVTGRTPLETNGLKDLLKGMPKATVSSEEKAAKKEETE